jgi:hypothetical protein
MNFLYEAIKLDDIIKLVINNTIIFNAFYVDIMSHILFYYIKKSNNTIKGEKIVNLLMQIFNNK